MSQSSADEITERTELTGPPTDQYDVLWKPLSLDFNKRHLEAQFQKRVSETRFSEDLVAHCVGMLVGPVFLSQLYIYLPAWYIGLWILLSFVYAPLQIYALLRHREFYLKYRFWMIAFLRVAANWLEIGFSVFTPAPDASVSSILRAILTKSPAANLLFLPPSLRISFKHHIILHTLAFTNALMWIRPFCQKCASDPAIVEKFNQMGYSIDWMFSYTFLNKLPDPVEYPCWMFPVLLMSIVALVVPTCFVFLAEVTARSVFLQTRLSTSYHPEVNVYANEAFKVAVMSGLSVVLSTWFVLSLIRNQIYH